MEDETSFVVAETAKDTEKDDCNQYKDIKKRAGGVGDQRRNKDATRNLL